MYPNSLNQNLLKNSSQEFVTVLKAEASKFLTILLSLSLSQQEAGHSSKAELSRTEPKMRDKHKLASVSKSGD